MSYYQQCGRRTARGTACRQITLAGWNVPRGTPIPASCHAHLTAEERDRWNAAIEQQRETDRNATQAYLSSNPACWEWTDLPDAGAWAPLSPALAVLAQDDPELRGALMVKEWQDGRCAICNARGDELVEDHDHATGLVRGYLCRSCNTREGLDPSAVGPIARYRQRHPTSILGVVIRYYDRFRGDYALPAKPRTNAREENPMRGIGL